MRRFFGAWQSLSPKAPFDSSAFTFARAFTYSVMQVYAGVHQVYDYWKNNLKPGGFGFSARIINYPGGVPGDVGLFFTWPKSALEV